MPTSDNDKTSAVSKVVDAFRARRAGDDVPDADESAPTDARTPVVKIEPGQALGGGDSETPTKAFAVPGGQNAADSDEADAVADEAAAGDTADGADDQAAEDEQAQALDEASDDAVDEVRADDEAELELAVDSPDGLSLADSEVAADDLAAAQEATAEVEESEVKESEVEESEVEETAGGIVHQTVVRVEGSEERADVPARGADTSVHPDDVERTDIVEHPVDLPLATADATDGDADTSAEAESPADAAPTEQFTVPTAAADDAPTEQLDVRQATKGTAAATAAAARAAAAGKPATQAGEWSSTAHKPEVIPATAPTQAATAGKGRRKLWTLIAALVALAVIATAIWYFLFYSSPQSQAAKAAERFQTAMSEGDLATLQDVTCGADRDYYTSVSPEEFAKAYQSQIARNQMMRFHDVTGVVIDGDTARVGVDVYSSATPNETIPAQVTLHKIDGDWKVCAQP